MGFLHSEEVNLDGKMGTTDYTENTDLKRVTQEASFTLRENGSNLATHS